METKAQYSECPAEETTVVAEEVKEYGGVIPFVSPEKAAEIFSSQRRMSVEESWEQIDRSLGRLKDSE